MAFKNLDNAQYMSLTTYRKNGQPIPTPVWFAKDNAGGSLFVITLGDSWKVKRIRHTPAVEVAPSDARGTIEGESRKGHAQIHDFESERGTYGNQLLNQKYGLFKRLFSVMYWLQRKTPVILEIHPE